MEVRLAEDPAMNNLRKVLSFLQRDMLKPYTVLNLLPGKTLKKF